MERYEPIHNQLSKYCRAITGNTHTAEDLMNDTILTGFEQFEMLKDKQSLKYYLFSIAANLNKMRLRRSKFQSEFNADEMLYLKSEQANPEVLVDFNIIYNKMLALPERTAQTLMLFHISDLSLIEIQKIQGGSLSAVKLRLKRGREKLLASLESSKQVKLALMFLSF